METLFLLKITKNLHIPFAAMTLKPESLCLGAPLMLKAETACLPCNRTNTDSVHNGVTT
jgi:hypothetical protein